MIVYGHGLRDWLEAKLGDKLASDAQFLGRLVNDKPVAAIAFQNWTGEDVEIAVGAEPGSATVGLVECVFAYVFRQLGCSRCTIKIRDDNAASLKLAKRLGFTKEGVMRKAKAGHDLVVLGLLKGESRYDRFGTNTPNTN